MARGYYYPKVDWISREKWNETKAIIRQYRELQDEYQSIIEGEAVVADGMPKSGTISDPTAARTMKAERIKEKIDAIEAAKKAKERRAAARKAEEAAEAEEPAAEEAPVEE